MLAPFAEAVADAVHSASAATEVADEKHPTLPAWAAKPGALLATQSPTGPLPATCVSGL